MRYWWRRLRGAPPNGQMTCHEVGELLQQYLDEHLDQDRSTQITLHLEDCLRCGMELDTYRRIKSTLAASRPEVSQESLERLRNFARRMASDQDPSSGQDPSSQ